MQRQREGGVHLVCFGVKSSQMCFGQLGSSSRSNTSPKSWPGCGRAGLAVLAGGNAALRRPRPAEIIPTPTPLQPPPRCFLRPRPKSFPGDGTTRLNLPKNTPGMKKHPNHPAEDSGGHTERPRSSPKGTFGDTWVAGGGLGTRIRQCQVPERGWHTEELVRQTRPAPGSPGR